MPIMPPQNPYNYQKVEPMRNPEPPSYPKFIEKEVKKDDSQEKISQNLVKEFENEIKELQQLTKEAKELAEKVFIN
jgi:hypothetical protein